MKTKTRKISVSAKPRKSGAKKSVSKSGSRSGKKVSSKVTVKAKTPVSKTKSGKPAPKGAGNKPSGNKAIGAKGAVSKLAGKGKAVAGKAMTAPVSAAPKVIGPPKIHSKIQMRVESRWVDTPGERASAGEDRVSPRPEVAPLKKKEIEALREILLSEKIKLLRHLEEVSASSEEQLDTTVLSGDAADIASLEMTQASLQKIGKREGYLLKKIELALTKITEGTYGACESCGEPISLPRLQARPVAQLCIDCKTDQESEERRFSTREKSSDDESEISEESEEG